MGLIGQVLGVLFGPGRNVLRETAEVFRENAEAGAGRAADLRGQAMAQFGAEFARAPAGRFDRFMDGLNRLPRPALALGTLALFVAAMVDPIWFAQRMQGIALVPEPLWWLLGVVVSFYFGARHQVKAQAFQREIAASLARAPEVAQAVAALAPLRGGDGAAQAAETGAAAQGAPAGAGVPDAGDADAEDAAAAAENPALAHWRALRRGG